MSAPEKMVALDGGVEAGIEWAICRAPIYGAVNGYVRVPEGHPWHGLDYDAIDVEVHGGLMERDREWSRHWTAEMVADEARTLARRVADEVSR